MTFTCPSCKTEGRYGLQTRVNGSRFWACNGSHKDAETGRALRSCEWTCAESQGLHFGIVTVKDAMMQVALVASQVSTTLGVRALNKTGLVPFLGDAAEELEKLADRLRLVRSYVLEQEQEIERAAQRAAQRDAERGIAKAGAP